MKKGVLLGKDAYDFVKRYVKVADSVMVKKLAEAERFAKRYKHHVVLKIISKQAVHKTEIKGVRVVKNYLELQKNFNDLLQLARRKKLRLDGILVQEFVEGKEVIIGLKKDPTFGQVIMFGLGGIFVELLKDVSFRVCPISQDDAQDMIDDLKGKKLLEGFRGEKPVNLDILKAALVGVSKITGVEELDINPFMINSKEGKAVDVRLVR
ncbi:acetate--CoA ligase family protein [Candidatus Woesearchaeota archaeon]|nr:acetate--CoA ligase family protein [Candidatus Woesearchaeota archaeon]